MLILITLLIYVTRSVNSCDSLVSIDIEEEVPYPSVSYLDIAEKLVKLGYISAGFDYRKSIYLFDKESSRPFTVIHGNLILNGRLDREKLCEAQPLDESISTRCCSGQCCMYLAIGWDKMGERSSYIRVNIIDQNDNSPVFPSGVGRSPGNALVKIKIHENVAIGWSRELPKAKDLDQAENGIKQYRLEEDSRCVGCFQIKQDKDDSAPFLVARVKLDREKLVDTNDPLTLRLLAIDSSKSGVKHTGTLTIEVTVEDVNDFAPQFESSALTISVAENSRPGIDLKSVRVIDQDKGINSQIDYEILDYTYEAQKHFTVTPNNADGFVLRLSRSLDYEKKRLYNFAIVAKDRGTPILSSSMSVSVRVTNFNDEPPIIQLYDVINGKSIRHLVYASSAQLQRPENGPKHSVIVLLRVSDLDSALSDISCQVTRPNGDFYLKQVDSINVIEKKKQYQLLNSVEFDREKKYLYQILITCSDSTLKDRLTSTVEIQLRITDINDQPPVFNSALYFGEILEGDKLGRIVQIKDNNIQVKDDDEGVNSRLNFKLLVDPSRTNETLNMGNEVSGVFSIEEAIIVIKNIAVLDYETCKEYHLKLIAFDNGSPSLTASAKLTIRILDANDNPPKLRENFYSFSVDEEQPIGTEVGRILATDADTSPRNTDFIYELLAIDSEYPGPSNPTGTGPEQNFDNPNKLFRIENQSGRIVTNSVIDHEKIRQANFLVRVRNSNPLYIRDQNTANGGGLSSYMRYSNSVPVSIKINDINDNRPQLKWKDSSRGLVDKHKPILIELAKDQFQHDSSLSSGPCTMFPYTFTDADEGYNAQIKVSLRANPHFRLEMEHSLICPINHRTLKPGYYTIHLIGQDRNGDVHNQSRSTEHSLRVQVVLLDSNSKQRGHNTNGNNGNNNLPGDGNNKYKNNGYGDNSENPNSPSNSNGSSSSNNYIDHKTAIIFIILIATIFVFCILLGLVIIKSRICIARNRNSNIRKVPDPQKRTTNNNCHEAKNYRNLLVEYGTENKRLWPSYDAGSMSHLNTTTTSRVIASANSTVLPSHQSSSLDNPANSNMFSASTLMLYSPNTTSGTKHSHHNHDNSPHQYEHMHQHQTNPPWIDITQDHIHSATQPHLYNYLVDDNNHSSSSPPLNKCPTNDCSPSSAVITAEAPSQKLTNNNPNINNPNTNQKSINDLYLQTSFV